MSFNQFTIGTVESENKDLNGLQHESISASIVDRGVLIQIWGGFSTGSVTIDAAKVREFGELLITAADNWAELKSRLNQVEQERKRFEQDRKSWVKSALRKSDK